MSTLFQDSQHGFTGSLTSTEVEFVNQVSRIAEEKLAPRAEEYDQTGKFPWANVELLNELGINGVFIPSEFGGTPTSFSCYLHLVEQLSRACPATAITWATTSHAIGPLLAFGSLTQQERYLPAIAAGALAAVAITEETGGSDVTAMRSTIATNPSGDLVLDGSKVFITNGDVADVIVAFAKSSDLPKVDHPRRQLSCVLVDTASPGVEVIRREDKLGHRASSTVELRFNQCRLDRDAMIGNPGDGFKILLSMLNRSRPSVAAQATGIALAAFEEARRHVNERKQFGQRILDFQGVQFILADMATKLATTRAWLYHVGRLIDEGAQDYDVEASILKLAASDTAMDLATSAVQLQGGYGYMTGSKAERLFRDAKLTQIWEGANELHRARIGKSFLET